MNSHGETSKQTAREERACRRQREEVTAAPLSNTQPRANAWLSIARVIRGTKECAGGQALDSAYFAKYVRSASASARLKSRRRTAMQSTSLRRGSNARCVSDP